MTPPVQLLAFSFNDRADFEGQLLGAIQRIESGGSLRVADAFVISRDSHTNELSAARGGAAGIGSLVRSMLDYRLDERARQASTEALIGPHGSMPELLQLADALQAGDTIVATLIEHLWAQSLQDAVGRTGGTQIADRMVATTDLAELVGTLAAPAA